MTIKKLLKAFAVLGVAGILGMTGAFAQDESHGGEGGGEGDEAGHTAHYPLRKPEQMEWSFAGPFGTYDRGQLQRGLKVYIEVCSACHGMQRVAFRHLEALGYSEGQVKALAAEYEVEDGPNADGEMFTRPATETDYFPSPYPNPQAAAAANNGAAPPDFSLLAKARAVERGFPFWITDMFTMYTEHGVDYIHALITGYGEEPPEGIEIPEGGYYNPYFMSSAALAMPPPIGEGQVSYDDGSPETVDQYSRDVAAFMMWAAEPKLEVRKQAGFRVISFLLIFGALVWIVKRRVWSNVAH